MNPNQVDQQFMEQVFRAMIVLAFLMSLVGLAIITWSVQ